MAEDGYWSKLKSAWPERPVQSLWDGIFGSQGTTVVTAPSLTSYPSSNEALNAGKYGFGYGDPRLDMSSGSARVLGDVDTNSKRLPTFVPRSGAGSHLEEVTGAAIGPGGVTLSNAPTQVNDTLMRAALTANRIPIAALGFDPTRMVADTQMKSANIAGAYSPKSDTIYYNMPEGRPASSPVHEAIHRGLNILRQDPANSALFKNSPDEESIVRRLMESQAGDPEKGTGNMADQLRDKARASYEDSSNKKLYGKSLDSLIRAAEEAIKNRRPGGPR